MNLRFLCFKPGLGTLDHFGGNTGGSWIIWATWVRHGFFCGQLGSNLGPPFWGNRAHTQTNQFLCLVMTAGMFSANMFRGTPATKIPQKNQVVDICLDISCHDHLEARRTGRVFRQTSGQVRILFLFANNLQTSHTFKASYGKSS